jgi:F0F1-type ATP synthase membrane subunit b/b'
VYQTVGAYLYTIDASKTDLQALLDKALAELPAKSPVRAEITAALKRRAELTARAQKAWATMRATRKAKAAKPKAAPKRKAA